MDQEWRHKFKIVQVLRHNPASSLYLYKAVTVLTNVMYYLLCVLPLFTITENDTVCDTSQV